MVEIDRIACLASEEFTAQSYAEVVELMQRVEAAIQKDDTVKMQAEKELIRILQTTPMNDMCFIFYVSILWNVFLREDYLALLLESALESKMLQVEHLQYLHYQVSHSLFNRPEYRTEKIGILEKRLYSRIMEELKGAVVVHPKSKELRNHKKVVVITPVMLGENHAPTHSLLERSYMLAKLFDANVSIISAKEGIFKRGSVPYYHVASANCIKENDSRRTYLYKDREFDFYQGEKTLDTIEGLQELVDYVENVNPYYIVYVGGQSYVAELLNAFCPVLTISTVFSTIPDSNTTFAMVGRQITEEERRKHSSEILEVPFSFELTEKKRDYTREELGIPMQAFVMAVVGNRLDYDVKDEFLEKMGQLAQGFFLFIGSFATYEEKKRKYPWLETRSVSLGRVEDAMGILGCADLYVNPKRLGGGFSVIEAFHAGMPAVSLDYGDVAAAAGADFCVCDYDEMLEIIQKYQVDGAFYQEMLDKALARELEMTNGESAFKDAIEKMLHSDRFY